MRAAEELRSAMIFRALGHAARMGPLQTNWTELFFGAARDEIGHAKLCAAVGARLGAEPPRYDVAPVARRLGPLRAPAYRLATLLLVEVAMGETISMAFFRAGRRAAVEPMTRAALSQILADEVRHQRLGWKAITELWPTLAPVARERLQREAAAGLAAFERRSAVPALLRLERGEPFDSAHAKLGVLSPEARVDAIYQSVERLVLPRLDRLGLDGRLAWRDRFRTTTEFEK
jgi:hypothetical protein